MAGIARNRRNRRGASFMGSMKTFGSYRRSSLSVQTSILRIRQFAKDKPMKKLLLFALIISSLGYSQSSPAATPKDSSFRYTFLTMGNKAGFETSTRNADGSWQIHFEFNDRGRGPSIDEKIVAGKDGVPTLIEIKGNDYYKAPVEEHFSLRSGKATWKNRSEQGEKSSAGK